MKKILTINQFFNINENNSENNSDNYFKNEDLLKSILFKSQEFANGNVLDAFSDIMYDYWQKPEFKNKNYSEMSNFIKNQFGQIPFFCIYFNSYNGQVCNGGHCQYFGNGYASSNSSGAFAEYRDIDKHDELVELFVDLGLDKIPSGKAAYNIMSQFELEKDAMKNCDECGGDGKIECYNCKGDGNVECPECKGEGEDDEGETCSECNGNGHIECSDCTDGTDICNNCDGKGEVEDDGNPAFWENLNNRWYKINDNFEKELNEYLKTLTIGNEKIEDLVKLADSSKKYNV